MSRPHREARRRPTPSGQRHSPTRRRARVRDQSPVGGQRRTSSQAEILEAALAIADWEGLDGLTIRKLAERLGVSPMGIYRYFRNKAEIVEGLVDVVVGEHNVTDHRETDWVRWVRRTFCLMRRALREHPGILPLLGSAAASGPNALAVMDEVLRVLRNGGIEGRAAAGAFHTLISYTIGAVAIESHKHGKPLGEDQDAEERLRQTRLFYEAVPRAQFPNVVELAEDIAFFGTGGGFVRGLDAILVGLKRVDRRV